MSEALGNIQRDAASVEDKQLQQQIIEEEIKAGIRDSSGKVLEDYSDPNREQMHAAETERVQKAMEPPPKPASGVVDPAGVATRVVVGGVADATQQTLNSAVSLYKHVTKFFQGTDLTKDVKEFTYADTMFPPAQAPGEDLARAAVAFATNTAAFGAVGRAAGMGAKAANSLAGVGADFAMMTDSNENISNFVQRFPEFANPISQYLSIKPGDTAAEKGAKGAVEGLFAGGAMGVVAKGFMHALDVIRGQRAIKQGLADFEKGAEAGVEMQPPTIIEADAPVAAPAQVGEPGQIPPKANPDLGPSAIQVETGRQRALDQITGVETPEELNKKLSDFITADEQSMLNAKGKPITLDEALVQLAAKTGSSREEILARNQGAPLDLPTVVKTLAYQDMALREMAASIKEAASNATDKNLAKMAEDMQKYRLISYAQSGQSADSSRMLNAFKLAGDKGVVDSADNILRDYIQSYKGSGELRKMAKRMDKAIQMDKNAAGVFVRKSGVKAMHDAVLEVYINALLSNPATHVKNFTGNLTATAMHAMETAVAPYIKAGKTVDPKEISALWKKLDTLKSADVSKMGFTELAQHNKAFKAVSEDIKNSMQAGVQIGEANEFIKGGVGYITSDAMATFNGLLDGLNFLRKESKVATEPGVKAIEEIGSKFTDTRVPTITADQFGFLKPEDGAELAKFQSLTNSGIDLFGKAQRVPSTLLNKADDFWKMVNYRGEVHALAFRAGTQQGLAGKELQDFMTKIVNDPPDFIDLNAKRRAAVNTFTNPLEWKWQKVISDTTALETRQGLQPLKFLLPFSSTPLNISKFATERTPLAKLATQYHDAIAEGGAAAQMAQAKMRLGSTFMGLATVMAGAGYITGSGPADPKMRSMLDKAGFKPGQIKVGDSTYPVDGLGPIAPMIKMAGELAEIAHAYGKEIPADDFQSVAGLMGYSIASFMTPETLVDSYSKLAEMVIDHDRKAFDQMSSTIVSKSVPLLQYSNLARRVVDPGKRVTMPDPDDPHPWLQQVVNKLRNQVPGYSSELPNDQNIWGEDILYPKGVGGGTINPFFGSKFDGKDPVVNELVRLGYAGPVYKNPAPEGQSWMSLGMPPKTLVAANGTVDLNSKQYYEFVKLSAGVGIDPRLWKAPTLKEKLHEIITSNYKGYLTGANLTDQNKRTVLLKYVNAYRFVAKAQMELNHPDIAAKLGKARAEWERARTGAPEAVPGQSMDDEQFGSPPEGFGE